MGNLWFDKLDHVPRRGSLEWIIALAIWSSRRRQQYLLNYAVVLSGQSNDSASEELAKTWESYDREFYPATESAKQKLTEEAVKAVKEFGGKPLVIRPLHRRRMRTAAPGKAKIGV